MINKMTYEEYIKEEKERRQAKQRLKWINEMLEKEGIGNI